MEPSCSRKYFDCNEGTEHVPSSTYIETKTDVETGDELDSSGSSAPDKSQLLQNLSSDPIDKIEREDFEEENRLMNQCSGVIVDARRLTSSSEFSENLSSANSSLASSSETICSLILNTKDEEITPECSIKSNVSETQSQLCNTKKISTPDNCCLEKNRIFTMNFTPPKPLRPPSIPKYKLFESDETSEDNEQRKSCDKNEDGCDTSKSQSIDSQSDSSKDKCIDNQKNNLPSSTVFNLNDHCRRTPENSDQNIDNADNMNDNFKHDNIGDMEQTGQGTSRGSDTKDLPVAEETPASVTPLPMHHTMMFSDYEDPDSGEGEEEEAICTCSSYQLSENEENSTDNRQTCEEEMTLLSASDSEAQYHSADENSRLMRKRKVESPSSGSSTKKHYVDPTLDSRNTNTAEYPPEARHWLTRFTLWSGTERLQAIDLLIGRCAADQVRHMMQAIEPLFQRDFISLLPRELALSVLGYLEPRDLLRAAETCRYWRYLADDNLLWKEQCRRIDIVTLPRSMRCNPLSESSWKAAFMRQHTIEKNWLRKSMASPIILKGHDDHVITCLQFYGNKILSGSDDTTLKVWSALTGRCLRTLVGHTGGVWSSQMIGRTVISGSTDRTLRVWDANTGACLRTLTGHTSTVRCMHLFNDKVVSGSRDATLRVWSVPDGRCLRVLVGHMAAVRCVQYNGNLVVSGAYDYFVKIWNPETAECLHTLAGHSNRVYSLQFDGVHVVSGSLDTSIMVWDVESGALKHTLMGHQSLTSGMELRSNILVSGNADSTVKVWDIITGQCLHTLTGVNKHQSAVTCLQSNNRFVITSSDDGTVKLWDLKTGEFIRNLITLSSGGSGGVVWRIRASPTKLVCAVGSRNGTEETKLMVLDFDIPGACPRCDII